MIFPFTIQEWIIKLVEKNNLISKESQIRKFAKSIIQLQVYPVLFSPILIIGYIWFLPNVYTISDCNNYERDILIFPKESNNIKMLATGYCWIVKSKAYKAAQAIVLIGPC